MKASQAVGTFAAWAFLGPLAALGVIGYSGITNRLDRDSPIARAEAQLKALARADADARHKARLRWLVTSLPGQCILAALLGWFIVTLITL